ncbi:MAG: hypothetical protein K8T91_16760 [Planctomycetes bacterium]|nr:hypothetical protein [Planctomycetota bacterium]
MLDTLREKSALGRCRWLSGLLGLLSIVALANSAGAAPPRSELADFLATLRQRGYADFAAEYLELHKEDPTLPADIKETWDIEMSNCLWISSTQTGNEQEAERRKQAAQKHLEAFLKDHPNHPALADAMTTWGTTALENGVVRINLAKISTAEAEKEVHLKEARTLLKDAHARLSKAVEACQTLQKAAKPVAKEDAAEDGEEPEVKKKRVANDKPTPEQEAAAELAFRLAVARFKVALADYWYAQTCDDTQAEEKTKRLTAATEVFKDIHKNYSGELPGWIAYYWEARILSETAKGEKTEEALESALEILDEVLAVAPDVIKKNEIDPATLSLIGDALVLRFQLLAKSKQAEIAADEAGTWLKLNTAVQDTLAYQGIALEWVKILSRDMDMIKDLKGRAAAQKSMTTMLTRISKAPGPNRTEAVQLLAKLNKQFSNGGKVQGDNFDQVAAAAEAALLAEQWANAIAGYEKALQLLPARKGPAAENRTLELQTREKLAQAQVQVAYGLAKENELSAATEAAEKIMRESPKTSAAPVAASLCLQVLQKMAADPKLDKVQQELMLKRLQTAAEHIIKTWPNNPEADEAKFVLGTVALIQKNGKLAVEMLTSVQPSSPRYSAAMLSVGRYAWRRYHEEMAKPEKERDANVLKRTSDSALKWLTAGAAAQRPKPGAAKQDEEQEKQQRQQATDLKLLLADVLMACGKKDEAMVIYQEVVDAALAAKGGQLDESTMRALGTALKANITRGDLDKATQISVELGKRVGDQPQTNALLFNVLRFLVQDLRKAEGEEIDAKESNDSAAIEKAADRVNKSSKRTGELLVVIVQQKQHSPATLVFVADTCLKVGMKAEGQALYRWILDEAARNPDFKTKAGASVLRIRAALVGLLIEEKKYAEALRQIDLLLQEHPKALDLLVTRGKILHAWAKTDPKRYDEAIGQWNSVRVMLAGMPKKPPEYYDAIYNLADCLIIKSQLEKKPDSANQAEKLLSGVMVLTPDLNGPDTVARFKVLIKRAAKAQGR